MEGLPANVPLGPMCDLWTVVHMVIKYFAFISNPKTGRQLESAELPSETSSSDLGVESTPKPLLYRGCG